MSSRYRPTWWFHFEEDVLPSDLRPTLTNLNTLTGPRWRRLRPGWPLRPLGDPIEAPPPGHAGLDLIATRARASLEAQDRVWRRLPSLLFYWRHSTGLYSDVP